MGFIDDKVQVINNVALFEVLGELPKGKTTSSLDSVKSKSGNLLPFLLDALSTTCKDNNKNIKSRAQCESTNVLKGILTSSFPNLIENFKSSITKGINTSLNYGSDFTIPSITPEIAQFNISQLDFNGLLKIDPTQNIGSTFYGRSPDTDFNWFLHDLVQSANVAQQPVSRPWKNLLDLTYTPATENFKIKINNSFSNKKFSQFLSEYTEAVTPINLENMMSNLMNGLTGSLSANLPQIGASLDKLISIEKINVLQDKINTIDPCKEDYKYDDSYFKFSNEDLFEIENKANQLYQGTVNLDLGCGIQAVSVNTELVKNVFDEIRNAQPSKVDVVVERSIDLLNDSLTSSVPESDKNLSKVSLNSTLINNIPKILTNLILEPYIVTLYQIASKTVNGITTGVADSFEYTKKIKVFFEYVTRDNLSFLLKIIFQKIKDEVKKLVASIIKIFAKEQLKLRVKQLKFITSGVVDGVLTNLKPPNLTRNL